MTSQFLNEWVRAFGYWALIALAWHFGKVAADPDPDSPGTDKGSRVFRVFAPWLLIVGLIYSTAEHQPNRWLARVVLFFAVSIYSTLRAAPKGRLPFIR